MSLSDFRPKRSLKKESQALPWLSFFPHPAGCLSPSGESPTSGPTPARRHPGLDPLVPAAGKGGHDPFRLGVAASGANGLRIFLGNPMDLFKAMTAFSASILVNRHLKPPSQKSNWEGAVNNLPLLSRLFLRPPPNPLFYFGLTLRPSESR